MPQFRPTDESAGAKNVSLVIIEAQTLFAPFLTDILSRAGFAVVAMFDGLPLHAIGRIEPRVVLIDIDYLDVDPLSALQNLRTILPKATICAYTERTESEWELSCTRAGASCTVSKAASPLEIIESIERALFA
jgi:DNA-binding NarL/FixJ family response regulator